GIDVHVGDIERVPWPKRRSVDVVVGGPPCQGFSIAGHMNGRDRRNRHVYKFLRLVDEVQPAMFVMENVKALATSDRWRRVFLKIVRTAREMAYDTQLLIVNAAEYGVPQRRERMFLIGRRHGIPPVQLGRRVQRDSTVRQVLLGLPAYG